MLVGSPCLSTFDTDTATMLDISFTELAVIGAVALVVLGPERLPKVARTAGHLFGRLQRYVNTVKADISREMETSELSKLKQDVQDAARSFEQTVQQHANSLETEAKSIQTNAEKSLAESPSPAPPSAPPAPFVESSVAAKPAPPATPSVEDAPVAAASVVAPSVNAAAANGQGMFDFGIEPIRGGSTSPASQR